MKIKLFLLFLVLVIIAVVLVGIKLVSKPNEINKTQVKTEENIFSAQTNSEGNVEVEVAPNVSADKKSWNFQITLTIHSGSLDEDLTKVSSIFDNQGNKLDPLSWEGTGPGGHHRQGRLVFPPFSEKPESVKLILKDIGAVPERNFVWKK